jgi:hypothetical protein
MSSKRRLRRASCSGKRRYDERGARDRAERLNAHGSFVRPYRCQFGGGDGHWHVGHSSLGFRLQTLGSAVA